MTKVIGMPNNKYPKSITKYKNTMNQLDSISPVLQAAINEALLSYRDDDFKCSLYSIKLKNNELLIKFHDYSHGSSVGEIILQHYIDLEFLCDAYLLNLNDIRNKLKCFIRN